MRISLIAAAAIGVAMIAGPTAAGRSQGLQPMPLTVYWIDVEGGAATLIVTSAGESVLVDAGNPGPRDSGRIVKVAKESAHLERIDAVVVTHLHNDHFGGVAELAKLIPIGMLYENGIENAPASERAQATVPAYRTAAVRQRLVVEPGDKVSLQAGPGSRAGVAPCPRRPAEVRNARSWNRSYEPGELSEPHAAAG